MEDLIRLKPEDNLVIASRVFRKGEQIENFKVNSLIPVGHKIALEHIPKGEQIRKFSQVIGYARSDILPGDHLHTHNIQFRSTDNAYQFSTDVKSTKKLDAANQDYFMGYKRANGSVGTRNYIAIITSVNCSATAARRIADAFGPRELSQYPNVDGVVAFVHGTGCSMASAGEGFEALQRVMWGYARHSNHGAVLMVGLGCEVNQIDWLLEAYGIERGPLFQTMNIQNICGLQRTIDEGIKKVKAMLPVVNKVKRTKCAASELKVALQCGGSDAWSGVTANPALGEACDMLAMQGGTGVLAETPEIYGAEHLLTKRAIDRHTGDRLLSIIKWWEEYTAINKGCMDNNPTPGNKEGGLSTILEKSIGAASKGGTSPLMGVYKYAEPVIAKGFTFMDTPGYDPASVTGQIAGGCNLVCFTTGRGSVFGSKPAPTIKLASNTKMFRLMCADMDINCGDIISENISVQKKAREIYNMFLRVASGEKTKSEVQGLGDYEFVPWQIGAVM